MPIWDGAAAVVFERSAEGNTATVLGRGDDVRARCDDAGTVLGPDGSPLFTAGLSFPRGALSRPTEARVAVTGAGGTPAGTLGVRRYTITPFSKRLTLAMYDPGGAEVGELSTADRKGRELELSCGGMHVASLALLDRDRGVRRTVERWSLTVRIQPPAPADVIAAAAILRYGKVLAAISVQGRNRNRP